MAKEVVKIYMNPETHRALRLLAADTVGYSQSSLAEHIISSFLQDPTVLIPQPPAYGKARLAQQEKAEKQPKEKPYSAHPLHQERKLGRTPHPLRVPTEEENGPTLEDLRKAKTSRRS